MANESLADVCDVINISEAEIPDDRLQKMVKRAEVTLELELGKEIDSEDCTDAEKELITMLAAVYAVCYLTGGSAVGHVSVRLLVPTDRPNFVFINEIGWNPELYLAFAVKTSLFTLFSAIKILNPDTRNPLVRSVIRFPFFLQ